MKIYVKAKPNAKENLVTPPAKSLFKDEKEYYRVLVKEKPKDGRANDEIIKLLAQYFKVSRSNVVLLRGATSKEKVFEIKI